MPADGPAQPQLGRRLRRMRRSHALTAAQLAQLSTVHETTISQIENGRAAKLTTLAALARVLGPALLTDVPMSPRVRWRIERELSRRAAAVGIGIGADTLRHYESGGAVRLSSAQRIADFYGITIAEALGDDPDDEELAA